MSARIAVRSSRGVDVRIPAALAGLLASLALGCATPMTDSPSGESVAKSDSRCAPGSVLDSRYSLCNGRSGRWW